MSFSDLGEELARKATERRPRKRARTLEVEDESSSMQFDQADQSNEEEDSEMDSFIVSDFSSNEGLSVEDDDDDDDDDDEEEDHEDASSAKSTRRLKKKTFLDDIAAEIGDSDAEFSRKGRREARSFDSSREAGSGDDADIDRSDEHPDSGDEDDQLDKGDFVYDHEEVSHLTHDEEREWRFFMQERVSDRLKELMSKAKSDGKVKSMLDKLIELYKRQSAKKGELGYGAELIGLLPEASKGHKAETLPFFHQLVCLAWLMLRETIPYKNVRGGTLADEMGLGKTFMFELLIAMDRINGYHVKVCQPDSNVSTHTPTLVLAPINLVSQWVQQTVQRFNPVNMSVIALNDQFTPNWRSLTASDLVSHTMIVINYEGLRNLYKELHDELLNDIMSRPKRYAKFIELRESISDDEEDPDDGATADGDANAYYEEFGGGGGTTGVVEGTSGAGSTPRNKALSENAKLVQRARRLVKNNLDIGFRTLWNDPQKWTVKHMLFGFRFKRVIADESTAFKNYNTLTAQAMRAINAEIHWGCSGTPLENKIDELYSLLCVLGFNKTMHSIRDAASWHRMVYKGRNAINVSADDEFMSSKGGASDGATAAKGLTLSPEALQTLQRRVVNVTQIRREMHNVNAVNPLAAYIERGFASGPKAKHWDEYVQTRLEVKRERRNTRVTHRDQRRRHRMVTSSSSSSARTLASKQHRNEYSEDDDDEEEEEEKEGNSRESSAEKHNDREEAEDGAYTFDDEGTHWFQKSIESITQSRLSPERSADILQTVRQAPEGFYWYTPQKEFARGVQLVDHWMREAFDLGLEDLSAGIESVRNYMRKQGTSFARPEDYAPIESAIFETISARKRETLETTKRRFKVFSGLVIPKPVIFVAKMHELERAFYENTMLEARDLRKALNSTNGGGGGGHPNQRTQAFTCITTMRATCIDYRTSRGAAPFFEKTRGEKWDTNGKEPYDTVSVEAVTQSQKIDESEVSLSLRAMVAAEQGDMDTVAQLADQGATASDKKGEKKKENARGGAGGGGSSKQVMYHVPKRVPTKYPMLLRVIETFPRGTKHLILSDLVAFFPNFVKLATERGHGVVTITGETKKSDRDKIVKSFMSDKQGSPTVLVGSLRCIALGMNLQRASTVHLPLGWWNGALEEQGKRRIARMGQQGEVHFIYYALQDSIEELVIARGGEKSELISSVIGVDDGVVKTSSNFSRPDPDNAYFMDFDQGPHGPILPAPWQWPQRTYQEMLNALPRVQLGKRFSNITLKTITSRDGGLDHTKLACALAESQ